MYNEQCKNRLQWLDEVKGLGILLMVIGHASAPKPLVHWIYGFHMPLFFVVAGYTFDCCKWEKRGFVMLMKSRAKSYLLPYGILFTINLALYSILSILSGKAYTLTTFLNYIIAGIYSHDTKMPNCAPLWFLTCLFVSYIFFWFIVSRKNSFVKYSVVLALIIILLGLCTLERRLGIDQMPWHLDTACIGSIFMFLGNEFKKLHIHLKNFEANGLINNTIINCIVIMLFILSTLFILVNDRVIMVLNQYGNIVLFLVAAMTMCVAIMYVFSEVNSTLRFSGVRKILAYWGKNTIVFIGFNYVFNLVIRNIFKLIDMEETGLYCVADIIVVMVGCPVLSFIWKNIKNYISQKQMGNFYGKC